MGVVGHFTGLRKSLVHRPRGTERPFSHRGFPEANGTFVCTCCSKDLFHSTSKYDSGSGWPSFFSVIDKFNIIEIQDNTHGMIRTEVKCASCDSHLGHLFEDGPQPSGLRYCINGVALRFNPE